MGIQNVLFEEADDGKAAFSNHEGHSTHWSFLWTDHLPRHLSKDINLSPEESPRRWLIVLMDDMLMPWTYNLAYHKNASSGSNETTHAPIP